MSWYLYSFRVEIDSDQRPTFWVNPQKPTQVGGKKPTFGPTAVFDRHKLSDCLESMFQVSGDFYADRSGGYFLGSQNGTLFEVDFNTNSYTLNSLRKETNHPDAIGFSKRGGGPTVFIASDFAKNPNISDVIVTAVQVHELGNKLAELFIRKPKLFPKAKSKFLRQFDSDAGMALEECVFGGGVSTNTGRVTTNP